MKWSRTDTAGIVQIAAVLLVVGLVGCIDTTEEPVDETPISHQVPTMAEAYDAWQAARANKAITNYPPPMTVLMAGFEYGFFERFRFEASEPGTYPVAGYNIELSYATDDTFGWLLMAGKRAIVVRAQGKDIMGLMGEFSARSDTFAVAGVRE